MLQGTQCKLKKFSLENYKYFLIVLHFKRCVLRDICIGNIINITESSGNRKLIIKI